VQVLKLPELFEQCMAYASFADRQHNFYLKATQGLVTLLDTCTRTSTAALVLNNRRAMMRWAFECMAVLAVLAMELDQPSQSAEYAQGVLSGKCTQTAYVAC
jgi:hypothetical protein